MARHEDMCDLLACVLRDAVREVEVEPQILPLHNEDLPGKTANRSAAAQLDIPARGIWFCLQVAFFDVRMTHPKADVLTEQEVERRLENNERKKKRQYAAEVNNVDSGTFTPLVFSTTGMVGAECRLFWKCLVGLILERNLDLRYSLVMSHLRGRLALCLLRWNITYLRGCRASYRRHLSHSFVTECRLLTI